MRTKVRKRSLLDVLRGHLLSIVFFVVIFGLFLGGVADAERSSDAEGKRLLLENVNRAVVSCYALEGAYPDSIEYLQENYGLVYDEEKYSIGYMIFASNIMPDITIIELEPDEESVDSTDTPEDVIPVDDIVIIE